MWFFNNKDKNGQLSILCITSRYFWNAFLDLNTRTVLSEPPDTMYLGFDQSHACTLFSWPTRSYSGAFGLCE